MVVNPICAAAAAADIIFRLRSQSDLAVFAFDRPHPTPCSSHPLQKKGQGLSRRGGKKGPKRKDLFNTIPDSTT